MRHEDEITVNEGRVAQCDEEGRSEQRQQVFLTVHKQGKYSMLSFEILR